MGTFRYKIWDPTLIILQIITLQSVYYVGLGIWMAIISVFIDHHRTLDSLFDYHELQFKAYHGRAIMMAFILNSLTCSLALWKIVQRTKQCLDFTITAHFIHIIICWMYTGQLPSQPALWLLHLVNITMMCVLGEYLCMKSEMHQIPLLLSSKSPLL